GFFGDSIRFRSNESVVNELLMLKARARREKGQIAVFFIDDNFAININRTKSLLRDIIAAKAQVRWVAQISANLLREQELVDLIAASGGKWIFIGMESIDPTNLRDINKGFNKPGEYAAAHAAGFHELPPRLHPTGHWSVHIPICLCAFRAVSRFGEIERQ